MTGTVLIVEDEDNVTALEIAIASVRGLQVRLVQDIRSALDVLDNPHEHVVAVITDLNLGRATGYELVEAIRQHPAYGPRLPVLVVSGSGHWETPRLVREAGADAYFSKPYSPLEVRQKLEELLHAA